ncbi:MAG: selenium metabolism-associated LysR family transcriptional regulator [Bacillota bacterium]|nr:selenium metabolism-associated LysR family transcriptional regulator [Bacillota bacterium]
MDFKQLESFITIAKYNSFSRAAEKLYLTQPTLSNHIILLERELDTILFNRINKKVSLTKSGMVFHQHALDIIHSRDRAIFSLNKFKGSINGLLEISSSTVPQHFFLANLIKDFSKKYPEVKYKILRHDSHEVIDKINKGEIDFGIVGQKLSMPNLEYIDIMGDAIVLVASKDFKKDSINIDEVKNIPLIIREEGSATRSILLEKLEEHNIYMENLNIVAEIENTSTIKQFVNKNIGLTFTSTREIDLDINCGELKIINIDDFLITRSFYFAYNKKIAFSPLCEEFKNYLFEKCDKNENPN